MLQQNHSTTNQSDRELIITRVFNAPRELVFKTWTEPRHIQQWFGPEGFTTRVEAMDFRPQGHWRYVMISPDGTEYPSKGVFREIVPPERIVTSDEFGEEIERVLGVDLPQGMVVTALFKDLGNKTKLTIQIMHKTVSDRRKHEEMGVIVGWNSTLDCLDRHLLTLLTNSSSLQVTFPSDQEIVVTRVFHAPRQLVFEAWTQPEHVKRWFGAFGNMQVPICEIDLQVGGQWRYVLRGPNSGSEYGFSGEYREIVPPERLVVTERYEPVPGSDHVNTLTLTETEGKTTLNVHILYQSAEHRNGHLEAGMETGMRVTLDYLDEYLQEMKEWLN
jgi:uncharacterized protein YndB with AHSA1/START domain